MAFQHKRPFGGDGVPVQLTHAARFQRHVDACHTFGDRKLLDGGLARPAAGQTAFLAVGEFVLIEMLRISRRLIAAGGHDIAMVIGCGIFSDAADHAGGRRADGRDFQYITTR